MNEFRVPAPALTKLDIDLLYPEAGQLSLSPCRTQSQRRTMSAKWSRSTRRSQNRTYCVGHKPNVSFMAVNFQLLFGQPPVSGPQLKALGINLILSNHCAWRLLMSTLLFHAHINTKSPSLTIYTSSRSLHPPAVHCCCGRASRLNYNLEMKRNLHTL